MPLEHRLQVLLDDERHRLICDVARERGVSVATVVREAIDRGCTAARRRAASQRVLAASNMDVLEPLDLLEELRALRGRRA
jgi:hypothetical protein